MHPANAEQSPSLKLISGTEVTEKDIRDALSLDRLVYTIDKTVQFTLEKCLTWHRINPDIYFMLKDTTKDTVIGYVNIAPVTRDCYEKIRKGEMWDIAISEDHILPYHSPGVYYLNFTSIVVHPEYRTPGIVIQFINAIVNKIIELSERKIYFKALIADAITKEGEKFCKLLGMRPITESKHQSKIYSISMIPPEFRRSSKSFRKLFDLYESLEIDDML